jgi:hypothetical protein
LEHLENKNSVGPGSRYQRRSVSVAWIGPSTGVRRSNMLNWFLGADLRDR